MPLKTMPGETMQDLEDPSGDLFVSPPPVVRLVNAFAEPFNNAVATARTCYSSKVVTAADVARNEASRRQRDRIAQQTYAAGHHTIMQHGHFQFALENVSRQFVWSFLHAHPFYNSEQVSQRYVAVKPERVLVPRLAPRALSLYRATVEAQMTCYRDLVAILSPPAGDAYFGLFPARRKHAARYGGAVAKKAQEVARYALPIATFAHMYHTVSGLTLHRYQRLLNLFDVPAETRCVVRRMCAAVEAHDPLFLQTMEDPLPLEDTHAYQALQACDGGTPREVGGAAAAAFVARFDDELGGGLTRLCDHTLHAEKSMARAVRVVLGVDEDRVDDAAAIAMVLSPQQNPYLAGALNLTSMGKLTRALGHVHYTFQKKLSHTADSQNQRHRTTPGSRPILHRHYVGGEPDLIVPTLIRKTPEALDRFMATMRQTWYAIDTLLNDGVAPEMALYLLPNAFPIRFTESGDLMAWHHKWSTRLCYNAQEEIWRACLDEVKQIRTVHPQIGRHIGPPCVLRQEAGVRPYCPEGTAYCGVPVWRLPLEAYDRTI